MADEPDTKPPQMHPILALLSGIGTLGFLAFLAWASWLLLDAGIPAEDRADLVAVLVLAGVGTVISVLTGARLAGSTNPFAMITSLVSSFRNMRR